MGGEAILFFEVRWQHYAVPNMAASSLELLARSWRQQANPLQQSFSLLHSKSLTGLCTSTLAHSRSSSRGISSSGKKALCMPMQTVAAASAVAIETPSANLQLGPPESTPTWRASLDFKWIRENRDAIAQNIQNRNTIADVDLVVQLYDKSMALNQEVAKLRTDRNRVANAMKGKLEPDKRQELVEEGKRLKDVLAGLEAELTVLSEQLQREGQKIPNMTHPSVGVGSEEAATVRKMVGSKRVFEFPPKNHVDLGESLELLDFEAAAEVSGTKFYYLKNEGMLLELALINWALSELVKKGFVPYSTPDLVRSSVIEKCGFQPRGLNTQVYSIEGTDLCLAGTAEILMGGLYMDRILTEKQLPLKLVAFSHCFRTEAGAAGSATRGLYRVHQFSKLEMFVICKPEDSEKFHEELISIEEDFFSSLGLHFKTLDMPSEDLGAPAYRKYDVEAWMPGLDRYGEVSSASNCTDYQSRRLSIRYRPAENDPLTSRKGKPPSLRFPHTLNATACAIPRMIVAILENFQQPDGSVLIPKVLQSYMGGKEVILPKSQ
ncbi:hypothetical protein GOP47_0024159 [Adiantum capillus-veneris]|uniref:serine--tRNA ligase n=1 Tax=Adiantum capillus-veneris TaxID=13818 RepID=A0A9D4U4W4_ADICA|nr:hypothetical protein GOP47_0024159 [Adiantum capillus-veneris]